MAPPVFGQELEMLKEKLPSMEEDTLKCETLLRIAYLLYQGQEANEYAFRALHLARNIGSYNLIGRSYHRIAWTYEEGNMDKSSMYLDSAEIVFKKHNDINGLGLVYDAKGSFLMSYGSLEEAQAAYEQAYNYYGQTNTQDLQAGILNNWAVCLNLMEKPEEAREKYQQALDFRLQQRPLRKIDIGRLYYGLAESARLMGDYQLATENFLHSYTYRKEIRNVAVAEVLIALASLINESVKNNMDTTRIIRRINEYGIPHSSALLDSALVIPGVKERMGFRYAIMDVRRENFLLAGRYKEAYDILQEQKKIDEENKLSNSNLEAIADLKTKYEKEQLKSELFRQEIATNKKQSQINILSLSLGLLTALLFIGFLIYQNRIKENNFLLAEAKREQQIISLKSMFEGQEKERTRIARDLHDGLGNLLSTVKANVGRLDIDQNNENSEALYDKACDLLDEACSEVRKIAHEMMPQALQKLGLTKALEDLILKVDDANDFSADIYIYGEERSLSDSCNIMLYRIVQELLYNIVKHAHARQVMLQLTFTEDWLNIIVEDDGVGFTVDKEDALNGIGLQSIDFRVSYMGGNYEIDSRPGEGTSFIINVPFDHQVVQV